jgi:hypothetical protein
MGSLDSEEGSLTGVVLRFQAAKKRIGCRLRTASLTATESAFRNPGQSCAICQGPIMVQQIYLTALKVLLGATRVA